MSRKSINISREEIEKAVAITSSAREASILLNVTYTSFIRYAKKFGLYKPNQGGKGTAKPNVKARIPLDELLQKNVKFKSAALKQKLFDAGLKENVCEECGQQPHHNDKPLVMQLDHIDGDNMNNELANLRILCPNCHTQTPTYCGGQYRGGRKTLV